MQARRSRITLQIAIVVFLFLVRSAAQTSASPATQTTGSPVYLDPTQPISERVDDLLNKMTLEEKASQLVNQARAIPRLQIPAYDWWNEALHGVANAGTATVFPEPIGLAATFDDPLIHDTAVVIGTEARAKHNQAVKAGRRDIMEGLDVWAPNLNIFRDPRWGRGQETYGEDPFLTARLGVAFVTGLQGDDPKYLRVIATPKHFAVHSGPESERHTMDVQVSKHDMEDTYFPAFRAAVIDGKAGSVMCAYNSVNGEPACANTFLLQRQLRHAWKFSGYVVSDCDAVADIFTGHHFTQSLTEAAAAALKAGMDNECADYYGVVKDDHDYAPFLDAVKKGLLGPTDIDRAVEHLFTARMRLGMFDPLESVPYTQIPESEIDSAAHRELALKTAKESMVLLKNDGILPLATTGKKILVVGPLAESVRVLHGNYSGRASHAVSVLEGIRKQFAGFQVSYSPGTNILREEMVIPTSALSTGDGKPGLQAEYFSGSDFPGTPQVVRTDPVVDLQPYHPDSHAITPPPNMQECSVRWTGFLTPAESGNYEVGLDGSMHRLWLEGKLIVDDATPHDPNLQTVTMQLTKGQRYAVKVEYLGGSTGTRLVWLHQLADPVSDAASAARRADVVIAVVGINSRLEGEDMKVDMPGFKGGDRTSLDLPEEEQALLEALKKAGKPLVVVLMNGSALAVNWANENANAILEAWYSGEEGGTAIAQTLAGANNPAGRLPVTFYKSVQQLPPFEDYSMNHRTYRYFEDQPLYPFGYGLSYSTFEYTKLTPSSAQIKSNEPLSVDVDVKNTSQRAGDEVVQLYLTFPKLEGAPLRALRAFKRVHLEPGEQRHLTFALQSRDLSYVNDWGDRLVGQGDYIVTVGGGQPGTAASKVETHFSIRGLAGLPE